MTGADLLFDADAHTYRSPAGVLVPSVTTILKATGVSTDFEALPNREAIERKRAIGTALHSDIHAFDDGDLDWSTVHPEVLPYVEAWAQFRESMRLTPRTRERRVWHQTLGFCGTLDGIFDGANVGAGVLIDVKTGDPKAAAAQFQTAGYQLALAYDDPAALELRRWSVQLTPGRRVPYVITPYADWQDVTTWQSIVATFYANPNRRAA